MSDTMARLRAQAAVAGLATRLMQSCAAELGPEHELVILVLDRPTGEVAVAPTSRGAACQALLHAAAELVGEAEDQGTEIFVKRR